MNVISKVAVVFSIFLAITCGLFSNAHASPTKYEVREQIFRQMTWRQVHKLTVLSTVPRELSTRVMGIPRPCKIAFIQERFEVMGLTAWTWNGRFIFIDEGGLYVKKDKSGFRTLVDVKKQQYQLSDAKWRALIGELPVTKYGKPIDYRFPIWPFIIPLVISYKLLRRFVFHTKKERLKILELDHRYQQAMKILFGNEEEDETLVTGLDDQRYTSARNKLIEQGIRPKTVDANLQLLARTKLNENKRRISDDFCSGEQLEKRQKWDDCVELYSELLKLIPLDDDRRPNAEERLEIALRKLAESQPASSCETSSPASKADELDAAAGA